MIKLNLKYIYIYIADKSDIFIIRTVYTELPRIKNKIYKKTIYKKILILIKFQRSDTYELIR